MPRPRRDSEILPAKERLENAFWDLLETREYGKITVTDIVHEADVNRNSFYYHFSGLPELADSAILHEVERMPAPDTPDSAIDPSREWSLYCSRLLQDGEQLQRIDRLALLAGEHGTVELTESLRDFVRMTLVSILELNAADIDMKTKLLLDFTVGGLLSVLQNWPDLRTQLSGDDLFDEDIAILAMGIYLAMSKENMSTYWRRVFQSESRRESFRSGNATSSAIRAASAIAQPAAQLFPR